MNLENKIIIPKFEDFIEFGSNTAYFHALFDNYLNPNLANNPENSLQFFISVVDNFLLSTKEDNKKKKINNILELLKKSHDVAINMYSKFELNKKFFFYENYKEDGEYFVDVIIKKFQESNKSPGVKINEEIYYDFADILLNFSKQKELENEIDKYFNKYNELILISGWKSDFGGHLISLYYNKINEDSYEIIIFNSGEGINNHERFYNNEVNVTMSCKENLKKTKEIVLFCAFFSSINYKYDKKIKAKSIYYEILTKKFNFKKNKENYDNNYLKKMCRQLPQLSGSCTFFGFYYNILYLFEREQIDFDDFKKVLINDSIFKFIEHLEKKQYITDFEKSYIDLIYEIPDLYKNNQIKDRIKNLYIKYKNNISNNKISINIQNTNQINFTNIKEIIYRNGNIKDVIAYLKDIENIIDFNYLNKIYIMLKLRYILDEDDDFFKINEEYDFISDFCYLYIKIFWQADYIISDYYILFQIICAKIIENNNFLLDNFIIDNNNNVKIIYDFNLSGKINIKPLNSKHFELYKKYYNLLNFNPLKKKIDHITVELNKNKFFEIYKKEKFESLEEKEGVKIINFIILMSSIRIKPEVYKFKNVEEKMYIYFENLHFIFEDDLEDKITDYLKYKDHFYYNSSIHRNRVNRHRHFLYGKYYINPYKIVEFINKKNVNSINNYFKKFYESENLLNYNLENFSKDDKENDSFIYDEFNLFRFDVFDTDYNANNLDFQEIIEEKLDYYSYKFYFNFTFAYSNIYKKNKELIKNLNQNNLIDIINTLDSFSIFCIIIQLYYHDINLNKDLIKNINSIIDIRKNNDNEKLKDSLIILHSLINKENNLSNIVDLIKSDSKNIQNIDQHINYILFSLIVRNYFENKKDNQIYYALFANKTKNDILLKSENIKNIRTDKSDKIIEYNNNKIDIFLNVTFNSSKKYLDNFIFKKNISTNKSNEDNLYIGSSNNFNYELNLKPQNSSDYNRFIITRLIDDEKYYLFDSINDKDNLFFDSFTMEKNDEFLFFINESKNKLIIENNDVKHIKTKEKFIFLLDKSKKKIVTTSEENRIPEKIQFKNKNDDSYLYNLNSTQKSKLKLYYRKNMNQIYGNDEDGKIILLKDVTYLKNNIYNFPIKIDGIEYASFPLNSFTEESQETLKNLDNKNSTDLEVNKDERDKVDNTNFKIFLNGKFVNVENDVGNSIFKKWIYNIPVSFLFKENSKYKILFMDLNHKDEYLYSVWNNPELVNKYKNELSSNYVNTNNKNYYIAEISYNGLELIFDNKRSMYAYIKLCIFFGKSDCLSTLINKINLIDVEECDKQLLYLINNNLFNSPYSYYYKQIININNNYENIDDYIKRFNRGAYPMKYRIFEKKDQTYKISNFNMDKTIKPFNDYINDIDRISSIITNQNNNLTTEQDEYYRKITNNFSNKEYIYNCIKKFRENYQKCDLVKKNIEDLINKSLEKLGKNIDKIFKNIEDEIIFARDDINNIINNNIELFYSLLDIKVLNETLIKINKKLNDQNSNCTEVSRIFEAINTNVIHTEKRSKEIMLFEIFFGNYIRKEQYEIYNKISNEIDNNDNPLYNIYQLLMGRGKTSVILPLIALKYILNDYDISNSIICLPSHLVSQTYEEIRDKYSFMLNKYPIFKFSDVKRGKFINFEFFDNINKSNNIYNYKKIIIVDCNSLKTLKLNYVEDNKLNNKILNVIKDRSLIIFDEFDSLYNPLNSDLNFPIGENKNIDNIIKKSIIEFYIDLIIFIESNNLSKVDVTTLNSFKSTYNKYEKNINLLLRNKDDYIQVKNDDKIINLKILKLYEILKDCLNLIYNKDYGFPNKISHSDLRFAVPYSHVDNPIKNSKFSDIDINFFMTSLTYIKSDFRIYDIRNIIKIIQDKLNIVKDLSSEDMLLKFIEPYNKIIGEDNINNLLLLNYDLDENEHYLEKYLENFNKNQNKMEYLKYYLENNIINELELSTTFYNCSFIDIMSKNFSKRKTGFSGTVNIKLPILDNQEVNDCNYKINKNSYYHNEFVDINEIPQDNGSIYLAILGLFSDKKDLYTFDKFTDKNDKIDNIIKIINENKYDSFIDSGAFLIDYNAEDATKIFFEKLENKKIFIYINNDDKKIVLNKNFEKCSYLYNNEVFDKEELFIYYDNKHIVGTDIKQPNNFKGLASVSSFNKVTDIAQASFRLRQLNFGHTIDFIIDKKLEGIVDRINLLNYLDNNEQNYICNQSEIKKIEQNINVLKRNNNEQDSYINNKFVYYKYIEDITLENNYLNLNYYFSFIQSKKRYSNNIISNLYSYLIKLLENNDNNFNLSQEQENEQEQEQQQEEQQNLENELDLKDTLYKKDIFLNIKNNINYYYNFDKKKFIKLDHFSLSNFDIEIYLSQFYIFKNTNYQFSFKTNFNKEKYKSIKNYLSILKTKNAYYLKQKNSSNNFEYLIISPIEFEFLFDYNMNNKNAKQIEIYDKEGILIKFNKEKKVIEYNKNPDPKPIEYFIRYILGSELKIYEFFYMFYLIKNNGEVLNSVLKTFKLLNNTKYPFEKFIINLIEAFKIRKNNSLIGDFDENKKNVTDITLVTTSEENRIPTKIQFKNKDDNSYLDNLNQLQKIKIEKTYNDNYEKIYEKNGDGKIIPFKNVTYTSKYKKYYKNYFPIKIEGIKYDSFTLNSFTDESQNALKYLYYKNDINSENKKIVTKSEENELIFNNKIFYNLLEKEFGLDMLILLNDKKIKEYLDNLVININQYLNKQDGGLYENKYLYKINYYRKTIYKIKYV